MKTAVFTIASRNYFAFVRTLMNSLEKSNPEWIRNVVVVDEIGEEFESIPRNFNLISLDELNLPDPEKMKFRYTIMEFNTAVKPFAILKLFEEYDRVIYIDPDIYVYEKMKEVEDALDQGYEFVLTPHFTGLWEEDGCMPDEPAIMRAGVYNLGFIAMGKSESTIEMTKWWADKLEKKCIVDIPEGIFVDQKWIDLVPGRYDKVFILRHEGYNIAYWNLSHRKASKKNGKYYFNNQPLIFFHYSGFNPRSYHNISKHQNRFTIDDVGVAKELFDQYAKEALSNEFDMWKKFKYAYANFTDGQPVNDLFRYAYRDNEYLQKKCGDNPYKCSKVFMEEDKTFVINYVLKYIWKSRPDLQSVFSSPETQDYLNWAKASLEREYNLSPNYMRGLQLKNSDVKQESTEGKSSTITSVVKVSKKQRLKYWIKRHLPDCIWNRGKNFYRKFRPKEMPQSYEYNAENTANVDQLNEDTIKKGINLVGYIKSEHGVGEAARHMADCIDKTGYDWSIYDFEVGNLSRQNDTRWDSKIDEELPYNISILNINADQMPVAQNNLPAKIWNKGYVIGVWYWELEDFPDEWKGSFDLVSEIWAPTKFIAESISLKSTKPVVYMPPSMRLNHPQKCDRKDFGLPEDAFLFLNMYDSLSYNTRKNPRAAFMAFKNAFAYDDKTVGLVVKVNNSSIVSEDEYLKELVGDYQNIYIISETLTREQVNELICVCDVAVSLHRSEGLGLLCEEAMYFGKPVIATNWSGNTDFMNNENSCLVDYDLVNIGQDYGPYKAWQRWAEPKIEMAKDYMLKLKNDKQYYSKIAQEAEKYIKTNYSDEKCAERMRRRLETILK